MLDALRAIAPVRAVRGNNDKGPWASELLTDDVIEVGAHTLYVIHDLGELRLEPAAAGFTTVLSGHSHRPFVAGERPTIADCTFFAALEFAEFSQASIDPACKNVARWYRAFKERPSAAA